MSGYLAVTHKEMKRWSRGIAPKYTRMGTQSSFLLIRRGLEAGERVVDGEEQDTEKGRLSCALGAPGILQRGGAGSKGLAISFP